MLSQAWIAAALFYSSSAVAYDYVVVGGGAGSVPLQMCTIYRSSNFDRGLTVANRLSENPKVTVAVVEAGFNAENLPEVCQLFTLQ